jgi:hypothetical protein
VVTVVYAKYSDGRGYALTRMMYEYDYASCLIMPLNASCNGLMLNMLLLNSDDFKIYFLSFWQISVGANAFAKS